MHFEQFICGKEDSLQLLSVIPFVLVSATFLLILSHLCFAHWVSKKRFSGIWDYEGNPESLNNKGDKLFKYQETK